MIYCKTDEEIEIIRENCQIVSKALGLVAEMIRPGISGKQIDAAAEELIRDHQSVPGFKGYKGFPFTLCISVNEVVVHGFPQDEPFKDGDIVSVDCGSYKNDFYGDAAYTFALGEVSDRIMQLLRVTHTSLYKGIEAARSGNRVGDIGYAIQNYCERQHKYGIVRELVGHGVGHDLHEAPEVPNYGKRGQGPKLKDGMVIAIEPMVNLGVKDVRQGDDGWTIYAKDRLPSAHYEHSVAIGQQEADILSTHQYIEEAIRKNPNVQEVPLIQADLARKGAASA